MSNNIIVVDACVFIDAMDSQAQNKIESIDFFKSIETRKDHVIAMPAHGLFEVNCTISKLKLANKFNLPQILEKNMGNWKMVPIDLNFMTKYGTVPIKHKAGDAIYIAFAKIESYPLITRDVKMTKLAKDLGVNVFTPTEYLNFLQQT